MITIKKKKGYTSLKRVSHNITQVLHRIILTKYTLYY